MAINKECKKYLAEQVKVSLVKWPDWTQKDVKDFILTGHQKFDLSLVNQKTLEKFITTNVNRIRRLGTLKEGGLNPLNSPIDATNITKTHSEKTDKMEVVIAEKPKPVISSPKYPVPEDLKQLIIDENPTRSITFTVMSSNVHFHIVSNNFFC